MPNLKFLAQTIPEIWRGSQNSKSRSRDPSRSVSRGLAVTTYLESSTPICLFTIQLQLRTMTSRRRLSDPWFDDDCRVAKRSVRLFERDARRVRRQTPDDLTAVNAATEAWYTRRREYRELLCKKRENFWKTKVDSEHSTPQQLWRLSLIHI